jgi:hypothetical protein
MINSENHDNESLNEKIAKLQTAIRWIKGIGIATAAVVAGLILVYRHERYRSVTAQEFVLTDSLGRERAKLALFPEGAGLEIYAASGEPRAQLVGGGEEATLNLYIPVTATRSAAAVNLLQNDALMATFRANPSTALLAMHPSGENGAATLSLRHGAALLTLTGAGEKPPKVSLETNATHACAALDEASQPSAKEALCLHSPDLPAVELTDLAGNRAALGFTRTADPRAKNPQANSAATANLEHKRDKSMPSAPADPGSAP